ncbi:MAG: hypothetical protein ACRD15_22970, partial [Vicinamibacterales bacterium]
RGDAVPHFEATALDGTSIRYRDVWQRKNLLLVALPAGQAAAFESYVSLLESRRADLSAHEAVCVITRDPIPGVPPPAVVVADRWGEAALVASGQIAADLPAADELVEWLHSVQIRCPECEGESR